MRRFLQALSWVILALTILPSVLFLAEQISLDRAKGQMLWSMLAWFVVTPLWMGRQKERAA